MVRRGRAVENATGSFVRESPAPWLNPFSLAWVSVSTPWSRTRSGRRGVLSSSQLPSSFASGPGQSHLDGKCRLRRPKPSARRHKRPSSRLVRPNSALRTRKSTPANGRLSITIHRKSQMRLPCVRASGGWPSPVRAPDAVRKLLIWRVEVGGQDISGSEERYLAGQVQPVRRVRSDRLVLTLMKFSLPASIVPQHGCGIHPDRLCNGLPLHFAGECRPILD